MGLGPFRRPGGVLLTPAPKLSATARAVNGLWGGMYNQGVRKTRTDQGCGATSRAVAIACCAVLFGCDQFASIGVQPAPLADSGAPPDAMAQTDAMTELDAMTGELDATIGEPDAAISDAGPDAAAQCPDVQFDVCNPVTNEFFVAECGPGFMQQCAIDQFNMLVGYCIFTSATPAQLGGACFNSGVTESCPATSTCSADGVCRTICLCDADCPAGQCCTEPVGTTGFSVCGAC